MSACPDWGLTASGGGGEDDDITVTLILYNDTMQFCKLRVRINSKATFTEARGGREGCCRAQEISYVSRSLIKVALESLWPCEAWRVVDEVGVLVEECLDGW